MAHRVTSRDQLFTLMVEKIAARLPGASPETLRHRLAERERQMPTSTHEGVAFPQVVGPDIPRTFIIPVVVPQGVDFGAEDHPPTTLVFGLFGSSRDPWQQVRLLARLWRIGHSQKSRASLLQARDAADLLARLMEQDRSHD